MQSRHPGKDVLRYSEPLAFPPHGEAESAQ
jgi:hypothetical protein